MSISIMDEGDTMGRGIPPSRKLLARIRNRGERQPEAVAVLGAGPAGLLAAHAIELAGRVPAIFSNPDAPTSPTVAKSSIGPATYLHEAIPDLTSAEPDAMITFVKKGTRAGYAKKVYGDPRADCSWDKFEEGEYPAWSLGAAYDDLWSRFESRLIPATIDAPLLREILDDFGMVVSSIPPYATCEAGRQHRFPERAIWVRDEFTFHDGRDPIIVYDGQVGGLADRYRASQIFGQASTEYASDPGLGARKGYKVLPTTCDCHPEVVRVGRFGEWKPGVLTHHAFRKVWDLMFDSFEGA
jgi:hypothetical protein